MKKIKLLPLILCFCLAAAAFSPTAFASPAPDLNGKNIGVASKSTTREAILRFFNTMNSQTIDCKFFEYPSYDSLYRALKEKQIDAVAVDVTILEGYVDSTTKILDDRFGAQRYGAAVKKENHALVELINQTLAKK